MIPVSGGWAAAVRASHTRHLRVQIDYDGQTVTDDLPVSGGTLTLDLDDEAYATAELDVAHPDWLGRLTPFGYRAHLHVGVTVGRDVEWVTVGPELLLTATPTPAGITSQVKITASSLIRQVQDDRFLRPYQPDGSVRAALTALLTGSVPDATITHDGGDAAVPAGLLFERERWDAVKDLAARVDCVVRPNVGGFLIAPPPQPTGLPVSTVDAGSRGTLLQGTQPALSRDDGWNGVAASNPDIPDVWALATLDDPGHPLRWEGPFGRRPQFFASPLLADPAAAAAAASTRLGKLAGRARVIEVEVVPDPALEPGDIVTITWPDGTSETVMIRRTVLPLTGEAAKLTVQGVDEQARTGTRLQEARA